MEQNVQTHLTFNFCFSAFFSTQNLCNAVSVLSSLDGGDLCWKKASSLHAKIFAQETSAGPHSQRSDVFTMTGSSPNGTLLQEQMFRVQKEEKRSHVSHTPDQMLSAALEKNVFCKLRTR